MATPLDDLRVAVAQLDQQRAQVLTDLGATAGDVDLRVAAVRAAAASGDPAATEAAQADLDVAHQQRRDLMGTLSNLSTSLLENLAGYLDDPCDAETDVPLVMLPVRLETRFVDGGATLKVRIFPDDVHLDRLDAGLSDAERAGAIRYWTAVWTGGAPAEGAAWQAVRAVLHPARAAWATWAMTPTNLAERPDPGAAEPSPVFPDVAPRTGRPTLARLLPDRFVVVVRQGDVEVAVTGAPVPDEVVVSLPRDDDASALQQTAGALLGPGMEWFVDYDKAASIGLALSVAVPNPGQPVDQVLAFGIRTSLDPAASNAALQSLLTSHRFGAGMAILAQGTPTNNTEHDRADWSARAAPMPPPTSVAARTLDPSSDAALLGAGLGLDPTVFAGLAGSDLREQALAKAAHTALWGPSWSTFLDRLAPSLPESMFNDSHREAMRDFFIGHVRGTGRFPTLRLGNQPYGILPVSTVDGAWVATNDEPLGAPIAETLRRMRPLWRAGLDGSPRVQDGGNLDETLLEVLGSAPQTLGLRVRSIASQSACSVLPSLLGFGDLDTAVQALLDNILWEMLGLPGGSGLGGVLGKTTRPVGLPLVADTDPAFFAARTTTVTSVLQALVALARDLAQRAVDAAAPPALLPRVLEIGLISAGDLAQPLRQLSDDVVNARVAPDKVRDGVTRLSALVGPAGPVLHSRIQPIAALRDSMASITLDSPLNDTEISVGALRSLQAWLRASAHQHEVEDAIAVLGGSSTPTRSIATADVIDCSSHRLDAWTTALVSRRLEALRSASPTGCEIGAYGWLENVAVRDAASGPGGYLLAPSIPHAATAAVLRSSYLHHNPDSSGDNAFAIDLSSARVRAGRSLLDGIRNGQALGALLGYRFERLLHESPHAINRFVLSLRALAPLAAGKLTNRTEAPPQAAAEAIAATDVVDGIRLIDAFHNGVDIRTALATKPANNPYLADPWPPPTDDEWNAIVAAIGELDQLADAVADLLMAEAVHQLVQGNTTGTAATLDAAAAGDAIPVDPLVSRIPARGSTVTYRALTLVGQAATVPSDGWSMTPRAVAEPQLETWARQLLGAATDIVCASAADGTLLAMDRANLSALDVVCDATSPDVLRRRLEVNIPELVGMQLAARRDDSWPVGVAAIGETAMLAAACGRALAGAQPLLPAGVTRAGDNPTRVVTAPDLTALLGRVTASAAGLAAAASALEALAASDPDATALARAVDAVAAYGVPAATTKAGGPVTLAVVAEARRRVNAATAALIPATLPAALDAAKVVFGEGFHALPVVTAGGPDLFQARFSAPAAGPAAVRRLLREVGAVRSGVAAYAETLLLADALARPRILTGVQLAAVGAAGTAAWLGDGLAQGASAPTTPVTCLIAECSGAVTSNGPLCGLVFDEWVEVVPARTAFTDPTQPVQNLLTAGLAANVSVPDARAPQAILLAVSPDGQRWSSDRVRDLLRETLELAKLRTVSLERVALIARLLPALQEQSWSLQGERTLDLTVLMTELSRPEHMLAFVKE